MHKLKRRKGGLCSLTYNLQPLTEVTLTKVQDSKGYLMVFCECPDSKSVMESVYGNQGGSTPCLWCEDWLGLGHQEQCHYQVTLELGDR